MVALRSLSPQETKRPAPFGVKDGADYFLIKHNSSSFPAKVSVKVPESLYNNRVKRSIIW